MPPAALSEDLDAFALECDAFLVGPDGDVLDLDIDPIFGKDLNRLLREIKEWDPASIAIAADSPRSPSDVVPGYAYVAVRDGVLLLAPDGSVAGAYVSCDLSLEAKHRGQGLGAELILEYALRYGALPTWHLDTPAYTPAGANAHRAAWRLAQDRPEVLRLKADRLYARPSA